MAGFMQISAYGEQFQTIDLKNDGLKDLAFDLVTSIRFMYCAVEHGVRILGGDILRQEGGKWWPCGDNWYSDASNPQETLQDALDYLKRYLASNPHVDWVVSVFPSDLLELIGGEKI